jgi:hypothetical protein
MSDIVNFIHGSTNDYSKFKFLECNRPINQSHVETLINDKTFRQKFVIHPVIVTQDFEIIDGQHRFCAAREMGINIEYIIDPTATIDDIRLLNAQTISWHLKNYLHKYAVLKKKDYLFLIEMMNISNFNPSAINIIMRLLLNYRCSEYSKDFKNGTLSILKEETKIRDFINKVSFGVNETVSIRGRKEARALFTREYLGAFVYFYNNEPQVLDRIMKKIYMVATPFPYFSRIEDCKDFLVRKIANSRISRI